jgi:epoxyqueuosine reductase
MLSIKQAALSLGFDACGIAKAETLVEEAGFMKQWLALGQHADMHYLERNFEKRIDPRKLVPGCKSVIVVLMNYYPVQKQIPSAPQIAKYAYSAVDYHKVVKEKLCELEKKICELYGFDCFSTNYQHSFVDSAPVLERSWAERAGLGWIGKNTQLIHPGLGSYTFIGTLLLNIVLEYDLPIPSRCGTCTKCIDACPTKALNNNSLDARRCISYLTIENKNDISDEFNPMLSDYAFGCDICADVCPWNKKWAKQNVHPELNSVFNMLDWSREEWEQLSIEDFNQIFKYSTLKRAGFVKLKKNIEVLRK